MPWCELWKSFDPPARLNPEWSDLVRCAREKPRGTAEWSDDDEYENKSNQIKMAAEAKLGKKNTLV